ncbi:MAG: ABC-2 transporter permease [Firmicutes bacterium]|nr:ABC-2 transporter permease [Bacillota bacterium]
MKNLLIKELRLSTIPLTYIFLAFALMTFIPGYPILCGAFFFCLGIFQSYQSSREANDILYSVLLPVSKRDVVKGKYLTSAILQMVMFALCAICSIIRMVFMSDTDVYETNALMAANLVYLAFVLLIFAAFNIIFIGGFFKTAYGVGKPFILFIIVNFVIIAIAEALHHLPGLAWTNTLDFSYAGGQLAILVIGIAIYTAVTIFSCKISQNRFESIDL